jgi:hypothetical protein
MQIANRLYYCPVCGNEEPHVTNHTGEIYTACRRCANLGLYCKEVDEFAGLPCKEAVLRVYCFNLEETYEAARYKQLCRLREAEGRKPFEVLWESKAFDAVRRHDGRVVRLYHELVKGQFVTDLGRLHSWKQAVFPNRRIKAGYYLEGPEPPGFQAFFNAYVECALFAETDESTPQGGQPLDKNYTTADFEPASFGRMRSDCISFLLICGDAIGDRWSDAGHDFWLTRNSHGAGFWDGDWPQPQAKHLTDWSKTFGEQDIVVGDNGKLHVSP